MCCKFSVFLFCVFPSYSAFAVSILSWWGYVDTNALAKIAKQCNTKINLDEYYSNDEFLRRINNHNYSVAIFAYNNYFAIEKKLKNSKFTFKNIIKNYHPSVMSFYNKQNFKKNVALYSLSMNGFLHDKKYNLQKNLVSHNFLADFNNKTLVFADDALESVKFFTAQFDSNNVEHFFATINSRFSKNKMIFSNEFSENINDANFGFAYLWIGEAYKYIHEDSRFTFTVLENYSLDSFDLIAALDNNHEANCVAEKLASKEFLHPVVTSDYYFSPYGYAEKNGDKNFLAYNKAYFEKIKNTKLQPRLTKEQYYEKSNLWQRIKIALKR
ncbi:MAG: hypothetical protein DCC88_00670 [Spirobacillus cienkowskii]|jgi:hypothetical protein|uniref:Spermidine/putrescine ABC transporter substrate-binding protein n=1 Tax=Spirobacillus cienkowskii TaxID=495820 RepID=A0A369KVF3_9BACT|nr:MAG: hypothetical protein DCC88_00670 [Spirobacillus cienkowskii]